MKPKFYVTTSIPYANGEPHLGHAMEFIQADVMARYARQYNGDVIFSTGTDEHGSKVAETAEKLGITPKELADRNSQVFRDLLKLLNISSDKFIRTTDPGHIQRAQLIWQNLAEGDVYKAKYVGWYDVKQEEFVPEGQIDKERTDPSHPNAYHKLEEENYFFKLSKYTDRIKEAIESGDFNVVPKTKRNEVLALLREGLTDISISRPKEKLKWGVPVPGDDGHVMYVWVEALMNYLTVIGYPENDEFKQYWPADYQIVGKDILRFHAAIWPAILFSLGLSLPKNLYVHGFINLNGAKMSKSDGNVVAPSEVVDLYGVDAFRYYLLRKVPSQSDGDFSWQLMDQAYHGELANELGNAVQRTAVMIEKYQNGLIGQMPPSSHDTAVYRQAIEGCRFDIAMEEIWDQIRGLNRYIEKQKPWEIAKKGDSEHLATVLGYMASSLLEIASLLQPFLPTSAGIITSMFTEGVLKKSEGVLYPRIDNPNIVVDPSLKAGPTVAG